MRTKSFFLCLLFISTTVAFAQNPREISLDNDPFDFTDPIKLVSLIIIPGLLLIVGALIIRNRNRRKKDPEK